MTGSTIYNATDGPLAIDRAGRMLASRDRMPVDDVEGSPLSGHISAERIVVIEQTDGEQPQPGADEDGFGGDAPAPADPPKTTTRARKGSASTQEA